VEGKIYTSPKAKPNNAKSKPANTEKNASPKQSLSFLSKKVFIRSIMKVEKVLKLPRKPTQANRKSGDSIFKEFSTSCECTAKKNPNKKAEEILTKTVPK
jgi:hypothetical protein